MSIFVLNTTVMSKIPEGGFFLCVFSVAAELVQFQYIYSHIEMCPNLIVVGGFPWKYSY